MGKTPTVKPLPLCHSGMSSASSDAYRKSGYFGHVAIVHTLDTPGNEVSASAGTHDKDGEENGLAYTSAIDFSVHHLTLDEIKKFLEDIAHFGYTGWFREPGQDGWPSSDAVHVHAIYVNQGCKIMLQEQVHDWFANKTGLVGHEIYKFWKPSQEAMNICRPLFLAHNPVSP